MTTNIYNNLKTKKFMIFCQNYNKFGSHSSSSLVKNIFKRQKFFVIVRLLVQCHTGQIKLLCPQEKHLTLITPVKRRLNSSDESASGLPRGC